MSRRIPSLLRRGGRALRVGRGGGGLVDLIDLATAGTFTRSTAAYYQTAADALALAAIDTRCVEDLGSAEGALVSLERSWTQLMGSPRQLSGGGWSATGGASVLTLDAGAGPDGSTLADRLQVTGGGGTSYGPFQSESVVSNAPYTGSSWGRAFSGTTDWQSLIFRTTSIGTTARTAGLTETWARHVMTNSGAGTTMYLVSSEGRILGSIPTVSTTGDTLTDFHNMVAGAYALRPVDVAGTLGADTLTFDSWDSRLQTAEWSTLVYPKWGTLDLESGDERWLLSFDGDQNGVRFRHDGTAPRVEVVDGGSVVMASDHIGTIAQNGEHRVTLDLPNARVTHNETGGAVGTAPDWGTPTNMRWGGVYGGGNELDGRTANPRTGAL